VDGTDMEPKPPEVLRGSIVAEDFDDHPKIVFGG
jgi:hypothetical protein